MSIQKECKSAKMEQRAVSVCDRTALKMQMNRFHSNQLKFWAAGSGEVIRSANQF